MTVQTLSLADFLLARIAEDEANPPNPGSWAGYVEGLSDTDWRKIDADEAAWDKRWAAECEAKRRIVESESRGWVPRADSPVVEMKTALSDGWVGVKFRDGSSDVLPVTEVQARFMEPAPPSTVLRLLAAPYADHEDYREEWRP